jgi:amidophosphoribosyltransferase
MVEWIRKDLGISTLQYQRLEDMIEAVGLPKEKLCLYCWTGECSAKDNVFEEEVKVVQVI